MAHEIYLNEITGQHDVIVAGQEAWHKLGENVPSCFSWQEAIASRPGLNYTVEKLQLNNPITQLPIEAWGFSAWTIKLSLEP